MSVIVPREKCVQVLVALQNRHVEVLIERGYEECQKKTVLVKCRSTALSSKTFDNTSQCNLHKVTDCL